MLAINVFNKLMQTVIEQMSILKELNRLGGSEDIKRIVANIIRDSVDKLYLKSSKHPEFKSFYDNFVRIQNDDLKAVYNLLGAQDNATNTDN